MNDRRNGGPWVQLPGGLGEAAIDRIESRLEERIRRGVVSREEIERVAQERLRIFDRDDGASEAFRRCCVAWEIDRAAPITSHRPVVGAILVAAKTLLRRLLRFQNEAFLARQREFNQNILLVLRELLDRTGRRPE